MIALALIALLTLASAAMAMALRNLIHSALLLIASWAGIAGFYLWADAQFVAFAQVLVYVGAVSMVVLFAVLLTRQSRTEPEVAPDSKARALAGVAAGGCVMGVLLVAIAQSPIPAPSTADARESLSVKGLGWDLMGAQAAALLIVGVILTVALLGAIVLAATDRPARKDDRE